MILSYVGVLMSGSRSSFIVATTIIIFSVIRTFKGNYIKAYISLFLPFIIPILYIISNSPAISGREYALYSTENRLILLKDFFNKNFYDFPSIFLGNGFGVFTTTIANIYDKHLLMGRPEYIDSMYIYMLGNFGMIGFTLGFLFILILFKRIISEFGVLESIVLIL